MKAEIAVKMFQSSMRSAIQKLTPLEGVRAADEARGILASTLSCYAETETKAHSQIAEDICLYCKGPKSVRNPTGDCDHLSWPENLTAAAKHANGIPE